MSVLISVIFIILLLCCLSHEEWVDDVTESCTIHVTYHTEGYVWRSLPILKLQLHTHLFTPDKRRFALLSGGYKTLYWIVYMLEKKWFYKITLNTRVQWYHVERCNIFLGWDELFVAKTRQRWLEMHDCKLCWFESLSAVRQEGGCRFAGVLEQI